MTEKVDHGKRQIPLERQGGIQGIRYGDHQRETLLGLLDGNWDGVVPGLVLWKVLGLVVGVQVGNWAGMVPGLAWVGTWKGTWLCCGGAGWEPVLEAPW